MKYFVLLLILLSLPLGAESVKKLKFDQIEIHGNDSTDRSVFISELGFNEGQEITNKDLEEGLRNLKDTQLFSSVYHELQTRSKIQILKITVDEKWTTIPVVKFSSGGGVSQTTLGVYDPNVLGRRLELGGQYETLGEAQSGVVWLKKPRLFSHRSGLNLQLWNTNRIRIKYIQEQEEPEIKTGFLQTRVRLFSEVDYELSRSTKLFFNYEYNKDEFSDRLLTNEVKAKLASEGLPPNSAYHFVGTAFSWGRLKQLLSSPLGRELKLSFRYASTETSGLKDFWQSDLSFRYYRRLGSGIFAQRFLGGFTTTEVLQYWYYYGGLDSIRGFADNRFAGRYVFLSNSEYRKKVLDFDFLHIHGVAFFDWAAASESFDQLAAVDGASLGLGLRFVLPKVYRFNARVDFAQQIKAQDDMSVSFGVQHFF